MLRLALFVVGFLAAGLPPEASAQDHGAIRVQNSLNDLARAQQQQAETLRRMETAQRDRARAEDRDRRNAERDSRSMRRFDR